MKPKTTHKPATILFPVELFLELRALAAANNRSFAGQVRAMLLEQLRKETA